MTAFPFTFPIAVLLVLLVFLYLIAAYASVRQCVIIICRCPQNIIEISLSRKNVHRSMLSKMPEMQHNLCDNLFLLNFKGL
jgi:multidrug efflux pump subunit AcrB